MVIVSAVIAGNALSALWIYAIWRITNYEKKHGVQYSRYKIPGYLYLLAIPTPVIMGIGGLLLIG